MQKRNCDDVMSSQKRRFGKVPKTHIQPLRDIRLRLKAVARSSRLISSVSRSRKGSSSRFSAAISGVDHYLIGSEIGFSVGAFLTNPDPWESELDSSTLKPAAGLAAKRSSPFTNESTDYVNARQSLLASEIEARRVLTELAEQRAAYPQDR